jgi:hypothetical protein
VGSPQVEAIQLFGEAGGAIAGRGNGLAIFRLRLGSVFLGDFRMRSGLEKWLPWSGEDNGALASDRSSEKGRCRS